MKRILRKILLITIFLNFNALVSVNALEAKIVAECPSEVEVGETVTCNLLLETDTNINEVGVSISNPDNNLNFTLENGWSYKDSNDLSNLKIVKTDAVSGSFGKITFNAIDVGIKKVTFSNLSFVSASGTITSDDFEKEIKVNEKKSNNNHLSSISIDGVKLRDFYSTKTDYDIIVNTNKITIEAVAEDAKSSIDGVSPPDKSLALGKNVFKITVTAEDGSENIYTINVTYEIPKSSNNSLSNLELYYEDNKLDFDFDGDKTNYVINVPGDVSKVTIKSELKDEKAKYVKNYGDRDINLTYGDNKFDVRVQAEDDSVKTYSFNVIREDNRGNVKTLSSLFVNGEEVNLIPNIYEYHVNVRYKYDKSDIEAQVSDSNSKIEFTNIDLVYGVNEPMIIKVTSEKGEIQEYKLVITRLSEAESKVILEKIDVEGYELGFSKDILEYTLKINSKDTSLNFIVTPVEDTSYTVLGNDNLRNNSTVIIRVTDDEGEKSYTINIVKDPDNLFGIPVDIVCYSVFGIGLLSFGASIIYFVKTRKKKEY